MRRITFIDLYKTYFQSNKNLIELLANNNYDVKLFPFFTTPEKKFRTKSEIVLQEFICCIKTFTLIRTFRYRDVLCIGGHYSLLLFNLIVGNLFFPKFHLYIYNFYIHELGEKKIIKFIIKKLFSKKNITLFAQSPFEYEYYSQITKGKVVFLPYCEDMTISIKEFDSPYSNYIFTGGYTNRDYHLLIETAKKMPNFVFIIVVSSLNLLTSQKEIPNNVIIYKDLEPDSFWGIAQKAKCIIVPLKKEVGASGQMLCLGAIKLKKPVIYCNISSINYYFKNPKTGIAYKIGDVESLVSAIHSLFEKSEEDIYEMTNNAFHFYINNFTKECRDNRILEILNSK